MEYEYINGKRMKKARMDERHRQAILKSAREADRIAGYTAGMICARLGDADASWMETEEYAKLAGRAAEARIEFTEAMYGAACNAVKDEEGVLRAPGDFFYKAEHAPYDTLYWA